MAASVLGKLLVVDDDPDTVDMLGQYFRAAGYDIITANHGGDGLMLAETAFTGALPRPSAAPSRWRSHS